MAENPNTEPQSGEEKQFTQADVDRLIGKRLAEERAKLPSKEELDEYRAYKAAQQTDAEKMTAITAERDKAQKDYETATAEVARLKHERFLLAQGVPADDLEYYDFKISKLKGADTDYEKVAKEFLKDKINKPSARIDTGAGFGGGSPATGASLMNDIIRRSTRH